MNSKLSAMLLIKGADEFLCKTTYFLMGTDVDELKKRIEILEEWMLIRESKIGGILYSTFESVKGTIKEDILKTIGDGEMSAEEIANRLGLKPHTIRGKISTINKDAYPFKIIDSKRVGGKSLYYLTKAGLRVLEFIRENNRKTSSLLNFSEKGEGS